MPKGFTESRACVAMEKRSAVLISRDGRHGFVELFAAADAVEGREGVSPVISDFLIPRENEMAQIAGQASW
jgi:hypothetical protein